MAPLVSEVTLQQKVSTQGYAGRFLLALRPGRPQSGDPLCVANLDMIDVLAKLGQAPAQYREIGERLHRIIRESAPTLEPIVRWGLPFYVKDGKDVCYIKPDKN